MFHYSSELQYDAVLFICIYNLKDFFYLSMKLFFLHNVSDVFKNTMDERFFRMKIIFDICNKFPSSNHKCVVRTALGSKTTPLNRESPSQI